jgi:hypothetical protein
MSFDHVENCVGGEGGRDWWESPEVDNGQTSAEEIRAELRRTRGRLIVDATAVAGGARELADWRYYVRRYPWAALGVAGALGYLAIPRRLEIMSPDARTLEQLAKRNKLVVEARPPAAQKTSLMDTVLTMTGNVLLRAGTAYMGQQIGKLFGETAADAPSRETALR